MADGGAADPSRIRLLAASDGTAQGAIGPNGGLIARFLFLRKCPHRDGEVRFVS
jgi:hypothetical protein